MSKIDLIMSKYNAAQASLDSLRGDISRLCHKQQELDAEAQKLAENGDLKGYTTKKAQADKAGAQLYVKQMQLKKATNPITEQESREAWNEYVKDADKELKSAWNEYENKRRDLANSFEELMKLQKTRLEIREQCAEFITGDRPSALKLVDSFHCFLIDGNQVFKDRRFFLQLGFYDIYQDGCFGLLVDMKRSM